MLKTYSSAGMRAAEKDGWVLKQLGPLFHPWHKGRLTVYPSSNGSCIKVRTTCQQNATLGDCIACFLLYPLSWNTGEGATLGTGAQKSQRCILKSHMWLPIHWASPLQGIPAHWSPTINAHLEYPYSPKAKEHPSSASCRNHRWWSMPTNKLSH